MAHFPCDAGPHPHPGRNVNWYVGLVGSGPSYRYSGRFCDFHWSQVESDLSKYEVLVDDVAGGDFRSISACAVCGKPVDELAARAFLTAYPTKDNRKDYWLNVHEFCGYPTWLPRDKPKSR